MALPTVNCRAADSGIWTLLTYFVQYSLYGHIQKLAEAEKEGLKKAGIEADLYQYVTFP